MSSRCRCCTVLEPPNSAKWRGLAYGDGDVMVIRLRLEADRRCFSSIPVRPAIKSDCQKICGAVGRSRERSGTSGADKCPTARSTLDTV